MDSSFWCNKRALIEIFKDNTRLVYTATILDLNSTLITFKDINNIIFSYNTNLIQQIKLLDGEQLG